MKLHHLLWLSLFAVGGNVTLDADTQKPSSRVASAAPLRHSALALSHDEDDDKNRKGRGKRRSVRDRDDDDRDSDRDSDSDGRNRRRRFPDREPNREARRVPQDRGGNNTASIASDNGYADGYDRGLDDARRQRASDATRHQSYRSADRGYDSRYGSRAQYARLYREAFQDGYDAAYRDGTRGARGRNGRGPVAWPWPF